MAKGSRPSGSGKTTGVTLSEAQAQQMAGDNLTSPYLSKDGTWNLSSVNMFRGETINGAGGGLGRGSLGQGIYVTPSKMTAEDYANYIDGGMVNQYKISKKAKIVTGDKLFEMGFDDYLAKQKGGSPESHLANFAKSKHIDGISGFGSDAEFVIYNPKVIKRVGKA